MQTVFSGIIAAIKDAVNNGLNLGLQSPEDWVLSQPAHLCAKVVIRGEATGQSFPSFGTDTPDTNRRIAQKNLARFDANIPVSTNPNIIWKNFIVGQPLFFRFPQKERKNRLVCAIACRLRRPRCSSPSHRRRSKNSFARAAG